MEYISSPSLQPAVVLSVSSDSITAQPLPVNMAFGSASGIVPNPSVLAVKSSRPCAALSATALSSGFSLSTVGSAVSFTVAASDGYGNIVPAWYNDASQVIYSKVCNLASAAYVLLSYCFLDLHHWIHNHGQRHSLSPAFNNKVLFCRSTWPGRVCACGSLHGSSVAAIRPRDSPLEPSR